MNNQATTTNPESERGKNQADIAKRPPSSHDSNLPASHKVRFSVHSKLQRQQRHAPAWSRGLWGAERALVRSVYRMFLRQSLVGGEGPPPAQFIS